MSWPLIIGAIVVFIALSAVWSVVARFFWAFTVAAGVMLALHFQNNPAEAAVGFAALGGGMMIRRPLMRIFGGFL